MVTAEPNITISLKDNSGNNLGNSFLQQAMVNDTIPNQSNSPKERKDSGNEA